jgi:pilus assembly protein CpaE
MNRVPSVVISTDGSLVADLKRCGEHAGTMDLVLEFGIPYRELTEPQMKKIRQSSPRLVFIDLDDDAPTGCKVARYLADSHPDALIVAVGSAVPSQTLVAAMRAGVSEFMEKPISQPAFDEAVERLSRKLAPGPRERAPVEGKVLFFCGAKGGAGSTTVATNFAIHLRRQTGERVLIVDLDLTLGEIALYLGIEPRYGIVDLARNLHRIDEGLLASYLATHESGLDVLSAPFDPDEGRTIDADEVGRIIKFLRGVYDWVVVDASNSLDSRVLAALRTAEEIFVVTQVDVPSLRNIQRVRRVLKRVVPERSPRVLINRFHPGADISLKDVERTLGLDVFGTLSNDYGSIAHSINTGEPLAMNTASVCGSEMDALVRKVSGQPMEAEKKPRWQLKLPTLKRRDAELTTRPQILAGAEQ